MTLALEDVLALPGQLAARSSLEEELLKLRRGNVNVVVVGSFKRGKSSLLNALIGRPVLPMGVVPVTALVTLIRCGEPEDAHVHFADGRIEHIGMDEISRFVSETENPENRLAVERVDLKLKGITSSSRVVLADTPGSGSVFRHNTETLKSWFGNIDAAIFVVSVDPPIGEEDSQLLAEVAETAGEVLVVLNKVDRLRPEEIEQSVEYTRRAVKEILGREAPLIACSARRALEEGKEGSGIDHVARWLEELASGRGEEVLQRAVARRVARFLAQEIALVEMESAGAKHSVEELQDALKQLEEVRGELGTRVREVQTVFDSGCRDLEAAYDDRVRVVLPELVTTVEGIIRKRSEELAASGASMMRFQREIESARDEAVQRTLEPFHEEQERNLIEGFALLAERALARVNELVDEAFERAAQLLGVSLDRFDVRENFSMESRLEYRVGLPKVNLDYIVEGLFLLLPPFIGRPLVTRRHLRMLPEALNRQVGLIRADLHERLNESGFSFKGELGRRVETAIGQLEEAVRRGVELAASGSEEAAARLEELSHRRQVLETALAACTSVFKDA
ncbi:MAG: hypothetical protein GXP48_07920 [Acidobacteria bacterium]|nr:hypothetical protein [Acidobacteriota bacterium]